VRTVLVYVVLLSFVGLGVLSILDGQWRVGVASFLLAGANALLLT